MVMVNQFTSSGLSLVPDLFKILTVPDEIFPDHEAEVFALLMVASSSVPVLVFLMKIPIMFVPVNCIDVSEPVIVNEPDDTSDVPPLIVTELLYKA